MYCLPFCLLLSLLTHPSPTSSPVKGSHQNPLSCLSRWPYYLPLWILVLTPLAASSSIFLFFCFQASHNSYPCQEGSFFILSCSHLFLLRHCCHSHSSYSFSPSPLPVTQAASALTLLSLVISIHKKPCCFFAQTKEERFLFFPVFPLMPCLEAPHGLAQVTLSIIHLQLLGRSLWSRCAGSFGEANLCTLRSLRGTQTNWNEF